MRAVDGSSPVAAILVPTHDHPATLDLAVHSALEQTVPEIEVIVIGDGVGEDTREVVEALSREDARVRFLDLPKGPNHGEVHRNLAIATTEAEIVCYLCDDDLLLPEHVASMRDLLAETDLAHSQSGHLEPDGSWRHYFADLSSPACRAWLMRPGCNVVSLTGTAHTVAAYRRLPHGWRTTPPGRWPDHFMWQQFLTEPGIRAATAPRVTALQFPSHLGREGWAPAKRRAELERWRAKLATPEGRAELEETIDVAILGQSTDEWLRRDELETALAESREAAGGLARANADLARANTDLVARVHGIESSRTWRLRNRLVPKVHVLERRQRIELPIERAFEFYGDARNLEAITPPWLGFEVTTPAPIEMGEGTLIEYRLKLHGVPIRWRTRIEAWEPPHRFVDVQVSGPYALWEHIHTFEPEGEEAVVIGDRVRYAVPLGPLGKIADRVLVRRDVERIFDYRREAVAREMGGA